MLDPEHVLTTTEPVCCASCGLRHTRRPDWLCPRCGMPVGTDAPTVQARPAPQPEEEGFPLGSRIAGAVVAASGAAPAIAFARDPAGEHRWLLLGAVLLLAVLGIALLLKMSSARWAAAVLAVAAAVLVSEDLLRARLPDLFPDRLPAALRNPLRALTGSGLAEVVALAAFLAGSLLLVAGRPRRVRIAAGALLGLALAVVAVVGALAR